MKKSTKKRIRDIRSALVMVLVMVAMLSTASYAWFTLTDSPTVTSMKMTAASSGGLQVSNEQSANFADAIEIADNEVKVLKPVTPDLATPGTFKTGVYAGNTVVDTIALADITDYVAKYTYYLKSSGTSGELIDIGIICGDIAQNGTMGVTSQQANLGGSLVRKAEGAQSEYTPYAIRVGIVPDGSSTMYIWEPNSDGDITGNKTMATDSTGITLNSHVSSTMVGNITGGTVGASASNAKMSKGLFKMTEGTTVKIDMYVWLEGTDAQCANEVQAGDIEAQIQFTIVDEAVVATP